MLNPSSVGEFTLFSLVEFLALVRSFFLYPYSFFRFIYSYSTDRLYRLLICSIDLCYSPTDDGLSISPKHVLENQKHCRFFRLLSNLYIYSQAATSGVE